MEQSQQDPPSSFNLDDYLRADTIVINKNDLTVDTDVDADDFLTACHEGNIEEIKLMIENKANVNGDCDSPIMWACEDGHINVVKILLENKASANGNGDYPLPCAASQGHVKIVEMLLDYGADIHANRSDALTEACHKGRTEVVKLLLERKADINADDGFALTRAATRNRLETVKFLIENKADVNASQSQALTWTCSEKVSIDVVKYLLDNKADVNASNNFSLKNALDYSTPELVKLLITYGADYTSFPQVTSEHLYPRKLAILPLLHERLKNHERTTCTHLLDVKPIIYHVLQF